MQKIQLYLLCCLGAALLLFASCGNDDQAEKAGDFYIEGKVDGQLQRCEFITPGLEGSIFSSFGTHIINLTAITEGTTEFWELMIQSTEHPDDWVLPKTFEGSLIDPFSDNINGGLNTADGITYGALNNPILCGRDWDWQLNVTTWSDNIMEGDFAGFFYSGDCDPTTVEVLDSVTVTEGRFRMEVQ